MTAKQVRLQEIPADTPIGKQLFAGNFQLIKDLKVKLTVAVGRAEITVGELFSLKEESVIKLDAMTDDPVEVLLDGKLIARGQLVVVDDHLGVSITEILHQQLT